MHAAHARAQMDLPLLLAEGGGQPWLLVALVALLLLASWLARRVLDAAEHPPQDQATGDEDPYEARSAEGRAAYAEGRHDEALAAFRAALDHLGGADDRRRAVAWMNLAGACRATDRAAEAEAWLRKALALRRQQLGERHAGLLLPLTALAEVQRDRGQLEEAEALFAEAVSLRRGLLAGRRLELASALSALAALSRTRGRRAEALARYREALDETRAALGDSHPQTATLLANLALVTGEQGDWAGAAGLHEQALGVLERSLGDADPRLARPLERLAAARRSAGDEPGARLAELRAQGLRRAAAGAEGPAARASGLGPEETGGNLETGEGPEEGDP